MHHTAEDILYCLQTSTALSLPELPREQGGIYALQYPLGRIVQIGNTGFRGDKPQSFYSRIYSRHRTGSEGEHHKASAAFNVGRMYRHLEKFKKTPTSRIRLQPYYGIIDGLEQTQRSAELAKLLRSEVISRSVHASIFPITHAGDDVTHSKTLNSLEREIQQLIGKNNLPWFGTVHPEAEPESIVDAVIKEFFEQGKWGSGGKKRVVQGDEIQLLEVQNRLWKLSSGI